MTLGEQVTYAHRLSRSTSNETTVAAASEATRKYINEGTREFCKLVNGIDREDYLQLVPRFDTKTWWGISVSTNSIAATDIPITATSRSNITGATVAADLQGRIQDEGGSLSSVAVTFNDPATTSTNIWKFVIANTTSSEITIDSPSKISYTDATEVLFSKRGKESSNTWVSDIPQDCLVETDLPDGFLRETHVEWDGHPLKQAPFDIFISPNSHGDPLYYGIKNKKIRVYPAPAEQKMFHVWFKGAETDLAVDGSADSTNCPLPSEVHMAPVYYATSMLLEEKHEYEKSLGNMRSHLRMAREYRLRESNANWALFPESETVYRPPRVITSST